MEDVINNSDLMCVAIHEECQLLLRTVDGCQEELSELIHDHVNNIYMSGMNTMLPSEVLIAEHCDHEDQFQPMLSILEKVIDESINRQVKLESSTRLKTNPLCGILYLDVHQSAITDTVSREQGELFRKISELKTENIFTKGVTDDNSF